MFLQGEQLNIKFPGAQLYARQVFRYTMGLHQGDRFLTLLCLLVSDQNAL